VVLQKQVDRAKGERIAELKAAGVPFEERIEALDEISWPKPNGDAIYAFYNAWVEKHPWVGDDPIRPKSVVREMAETYASFAEYINLLGLHRSEGVLLRYLTEAYKALVQNVPAELHNDALDELIAWLRATLAHVDSTLVAEWEEMLHGPSEAEQRKIDISADRASFVRRVRAELHAVVRSMAREAWDEAAGGVRRAEDGPWDAGEIAAALQPFLAEHGAVAFDHRARLADNTLIRPVGPHQWEVRQTLFPRAQAEASEWETDEDADDRTWTIEGRIDLRDDTNPEGPLVEVVRIGG
jgi:hypothetical protein